MTTKDKYMEYLEAGTSFKDLVLPEAIVKSLDRFLNEYKHRKALQRVGLKPRRRLLLSGPPGCGKTSIAHALAHQAKVKLAYVHTERLIDSHLGFTPNAVRNLFDELGSRRCVVLLDEIDMIASHRVSHSNDGAGDEMARSTNAFLRALDSYKGNSMFVGTTNANDAIDRAVWRRFDDVIDVPMPTDEAYQRLVDKRMKHYPMDSNIRDEVIDVILMNRMSMADADRYCEDIKKNVVIDMNLDPNIEDLADIQFIVKTEHVQNATNGVMLRHDVIA